MWRHVAWLNQEGIALHKVVGLHNVVEKSGGKVGDKMHSEPTAAVMTIVLGMTSRMTWIQYLQKRDKLSYGWDTIDDSDVNNTKNKELGMWIQTCVGGLPHRLHWCFVTELSASGADLCDAVVDAVTGQNLDYGFDQLLKYEIEVLQDAEYRKISQAITQNLEDNSGLPDNEFKNDDIGDSDDDLSFWQVSPLLKKRKNISDKENNVAQSQTHTQRKNGLNSHAMQILQRFLQVTNPRLRGFSKQFFLKTLLSNTSDGARNFSGRKHGLVGQVECLCKNKKNATNTLILVNQ